MHTLHASPCTTPHELVSIPELCNLKRPCGNCDKSINVDGRKRRANDASDKNSRESKPSPCLRKAGAWRRPTFGAFPQLEAVSRRPSPHQEQVASEPKHLSQQQRQSDKVVEVQTQRKEVPEQHPHPQFPGPSRQRRTRSSTPVKTEPHEGPSDVSHITCST